MNNKNPVLMKKKNTFFIKIREVTIELGKNKVLFAMLLPGLVLIILLNYLPMAGILIAFKDFKFLGSNFIESFFLSDWIGFENFKFLFNSPDTLIFTRNTLLYNLTFILLGNVVAVFFAIGLNEIRKKYLFKIYQSVILLPYFLSWIVISYLFFAFLSIDKGFINAGILEPLGIAPISWYSESVYWPFILIFANIFKFAGYNCILYLATLTGIDPAYYEAALLDGASKWQQTKYITIPMLSNVAIILVIFGLGKIFNADFGLFYQVPLDSGALYDVTMVLDTYIYNGLRGSGDLGMSSAAGFYQSIVGFGLVLVVNGIIRKIDREKALF